MYIRPTPFTPPAPKPRKTIPSLVETIWIAYRNPLELWHESAYELDWVMVDGVWGAPAVIVNDPGLIRHILVTNVKNYRMARVRQQVLRPILGDGLLTAEGDTWKRPRKLIASSFAPRQIRSFAAPMLAKMLRFVERYHGTEGPVEMAREMTGLTYEIVAATLFSDEIAGGIDIFENEVNQLFATMGRIDPLDVLGAPDWLPRITRLRGQRALACLHSMVTKTVDIRKERIRRDPAAVPRDFLSLLLQTEGPGGLTRAEIDDNLFTFVGAGYETTARALAWTLYCLAGAPWERERVEEEIDRVLASEPEPAKWLDMMPLTRAAFEEAMRLYPPAPGISREAIEGDRYEDLEIARGTQVMIAPWTVHRHRKLWELPDAFMPERFHPGNRETIDRYQYLPFGAGPRICIGASFAMQEAMIALAVLLSRFRFDTIPETRPWPVQRLTTQPQGGLPMRVRPRHC